MTDHTDHLNYLIERLYRYGRARNRAVDPEPRDITITDDECLMLLSTLSHRQIGNVLVVENDYGSHCYGCGCDSDGAMPECPCECHPLPGQRIWVPA